MGLRTYNIKAIGPSGKVVWQQDVDKDVELPKSTIDRGIREVIGYSGKYALYLDGRLVK
jgi:hypothetical protein